MHLLTAPDKTGLRLPALVAGVALSVYVATLQRTLPAGDSGELIAVVCSNGVAHPPGYPLYTLLAQVWLRVCAFGEPALRLAVFSAVCQAAAAGLFAAAVRRLGAVATVAAAVALLWAFSAPVWKMALVAEVFALNSLMAAGLWYGLAVLLTARDERAHRRALTGLLALTVLGLSHHHSLFIVALPVDAVALVVWWRRGRPGGSGRFTFVLAGVAVLCLLPLLSLLPPRDDAATVWGQNSTWRGLWHHLLRRDYGTFSLEPAGGGYVADRKHVRLWLANVPHALGYPGLVLVMAGLAALAVRAWRGGRGARPLAAAFGGALGLQLLFFARVGFPVAPEYLRGVVERFYILPAMMLALLAGLAPAPAVAPGPRRWAFGALMVAAVLAPLGLHWRAVDQHRNSFYADFVQDVLASAPPGAALFVQGDLLHNGLAYATGVQRQRPDLAWADQELLTYDWYVRRLRRREPGLLPPLGLADRVRLADGLVMTGRLREGPGDSLRLLTLAGWQVVAADRVSRVERDLSPTIFAKELDAEHGDRYLAGGADRYSGLPGSQNVFWIDHLAPSRAVAMTNFKETSFARDFAAVPHGLASLLMPRGQDSPVAEQARETARLLEAMRLESWFQPQNRWSLENAGRELVLAFVLQATQLFSRPEAAAVRRADYPGLAVLGAWLDRYRREAAPGDPRVHYASGYLHLLHPDFRDLAAAEADLARLREIATTDAAAGRAADTLAASLARVHEIGAK